MNKKVVDLDANLIPIVSQGNDFEWLCYGIICH